MRGVVIVCVALLVALVSASPLALEKTKDESPPLRVVDVPAGVFDNAEESKPDAVSNLKEGEPSKVEETPVASVDEKKDSDKSDAVEVKPIKETTETDDDEQAPHVFGFRLPSVVIFRRPAIFRDPFASFQSPFFSSRPSFFSSSSNEEKDVEPVPLANKDEDTAQNGSGPKVTVVSMDDVMHRMHQQINNLWTNLFNADNFYLPRPTFSRPSFFTPAFPAAGSAEDENLDFDKLPANYSNSTSETKIVDGQVVTVNKTIHKVSSNDSNGFFHFSVIKIHNNHPEETGEKKPITSSPTPVIGIENNPESSVPKETSVPAETPSSTAKTADMDPSLNEVDRADDVAENEFKLPEVELNNKYEIENDKATDSQQQMTDEQIMIIPIKSEKLIKAPAFGTKRGADLSSDIRVNNLMATGDIGRLRALYDPDEVEVFEV